MFFFTWFTFQSRKSYWTWNHRYLQSNLMAFISTLHNVRTSMIGAHLDYPFSAEQITVLTMSWHVTLSLKTTHRDHFTKLQFCFHLVVVSLLCCGLNEPGRNIQYTPIQKNNIWLCKNNITQVSIVIWSLSQTEPTPKNILGHHVVLVTLYYLCVCAGRSCTTHNHPPSTVASDWSYRCSSMAPMLFSVWPFAVLARAWELSEFCFCLTMCGFYLYIPWGPVGPGGPGSPGNPRFPFIPLITWNRARTGVFKFTKK